MKVLVKRGEITNWKTEAAIVPCFEGGRKLQGKVKLLDRVSGGLIGEIIAGGDFEGKHLQVSVTYTGRGVPAKRIVLVGVGKKENFSLEKLRGAYAQAARQVRSLKLAEFATSLDFIDSGMSLAEMAKAVAEGVLLGLYMYTSFKTVDSDQLKEMKAVTIVEEKKAMCDIISAATREAEIISSAVNFTRDMVSAPGNEMTPTDMAREARKVAKRRNVKLTVLDEGEIKKVGMNAFLGVARGSEEPAKFIILEYRGGNKSDPPVAIIGKGLTFDSGGISIKPSEKMDEMKSDMAGGAAVMGAVMAAADLGLKVNIVGLIPATENLPGGRAYKPGDILKSLSGQTIEVLSTDAEGRLILADALTYAGRFKPAAIIDLATLTGACVIALGENVSGMMGTDDRLKKMIRDAADASDEKVWELPLWEEYHEQIKSDVADYKNHGGRPGAAITAAAFLSKFVGNYPWVHLDIAGPAWLSKDRPYIPKGASGVGVRLLVQFLMTCQKRNVI
ncbi:MAG TPA: leucyl aminopeptidase [Syntrophales bacterium]|nr:leucyl aminopeptidase [Syntrophales bacterium]